MQLSEAFILLIFILIQFLDVALLTAGVFSTDSIAPVLILSVLPRSDTIFVCIN